MKTIFSCIASFLLILVFFNIFLITESFASKILSIFFIILCIIFIFDTFFNRKDKLLDKCYSKIFYFLIQFLVCSIMFVGTYITPSGQAVYRAVLYLLSGLGILVSIYCIARLLSQEKATRARRLG